MVNTLIEMQLPYLPLTDIVIVPDHISIVFTLLFIRLVPCLLDHTFQLNELLEILKRIGYSVLRRSILALLLFFESFYGL